MKRKLLLPCTLLAAFILWTVLVCTVDIRPIGPMESLVGLAALNQWFHSLTGVHMNLYRITDLLSIIPLGIIPVFGMTGLLQWIRRKKLRLVDFDILALGGFYAVVMLLFIFFEICVVNYRPILIEGVREASYPSSTTMLVMCVMPTAMMQIHWKIRNSFVGYTLSILMGSFMVFMVVARMLSGVHWLTDILGGALLSAGLVMLYRAICSFIQNSAL